MKKKEHKNNFSSKKVSNYNFELKKSLLDIINDFEFFFSPEYIIDKHQRHPIALISLKEIDEF